MLLAALLIGALLFQIAVWVHYGRVMWADAGHFRPAMLGNWALTLNLVFVTPFACLLLGFYVAAVRIWDLRAWLLLALLISFSLLSDGTNYPDDVMAWQSPIKHAALLYRSAGFFTWPLWMALFAIYFPERAGFDRRHPLWKWLLLIPLVAVCFEMIAARVAVNEDPNMRMIFGSGQGVLVTSVFWVGILFFLGVLGAKFTVTRQADERRRLRVLLIGLGVSFVPPFLMDTVAKIMHTRETTFSAWLQVPAFTVIVLFPITLAYVTVVQRAMDVRVILREGLQYAMARRGLVVVQMLIAAAVVLFVTVMSEGVAFLPRVGLTAGGIAFIFVIGIGVRRLAQDIDRHFFREAYRSEQILAGLSESVGSLVELTPLLATVATRIAEALHIREIAVFLCEQNAYQLAFAQGYAEQPATAFAEQSRTIRELRAATSALPLYFDDPRSWATDATTEERTQLNALQAQLIVPLKRREELLGFMSLGARRSEAPYSASDVDLLQSVAQQTAFAIENSRLTTTIAAETAEREVLHRELAIARDVQQRLLPQKFPEIEGIQCFGMCRPAREVGGDYFDFLELPDAVLGVAIGDVSGKGIPASLLMASLQASLRGQTLNGCDDLEKLMTNLNRLVYAASSSNRYATFFYAQYECASGRLRYVNAGHNPPLVFQAGGVVKRLDAGGPPVGLLPHASYESAECTLQRGDLAVLFTDGISEAMNGRDEEWGEENLSSSVREAGVRDPRVLIAHVFERADQFVGAAPQHDDMTIVMLAIEKVS